MELLIYNDLYERIKEKVEKKYPNRIVTAFIGKAWHKYRFIKISCIGRLEFQDLHYEYINGYIELHLEPTSNDDDFNELRRYLNNNLPSNGSCSWHRWHSLRQGRYRYCEEIRDEEHFLSAFENLYNIVEPILAQFNVECSDNNHQQILQPLNLIKPTLNICEDSLRMDISAVRDLPFEYMEIPNYQRPYKWTQRNVHQLINDILLFKTLSKSYRLGTLILHQHNQRYDIVDGQQRMITLAIVVKYLLSDENISESLDQEEITEINNRLGYFLQYAQFSNPISIKNIRLNIVVVKSRLAELDSSFLKYLLYNCELVIIKLTNISEAFQLFDSQNSRGKDLDPHDLLKAFHLREIRAIESKQMEQIRYWESIKSENLADLFLAMYRVKMWSRRESGRFFTKGDIGVFKGVSLSEDHRFPLIMKEIICHYYIESYKNDPARAIDRSTLEYPFQLDSVCINGESFFNMIKKYNHLYNYVRDIANFKEWSEATQILSLLNSYETRWRIGDQYVRALFDTTLLYYVDKFGLYEMDRVVSKVFQWAYRVRLEHFAVQLVTVDNYAKEDPLYKIIKDSLSPADVLNYTLPSVINYAPNASEELKQQFTNYNITK